MDSISEFNRKYGQKNKKNNDTLYKMDWFDTDNFDNMIARPRNRSRKSPPVEKAVADRSKSSSPRSKSRSSKDKSLLKEIVAAVNLEELVVPSKKASSIVIIELSFMLTVTKRCGAEKLNACVLTCPDIAWTVFFKR